jgi:hypothetical protein
VQLATESPPATVPNVPLGHDVHLVAPAAAAYVPGAHKPQELAPLWPVNALKVPGLHASHAAASLVWPVSTP